MKKLFTTDGIRAPVNSAIFSSSFVRKIAYCAAKSLHLKGLVLIGCDTRESSARIQNDCVAGFAQAGIECLTTGVIPTAALGYLVGQHVEVGLGVIVTASHNLYHDNGLKFFDASGKKLSDAQISQLEACIDDTDNVDIHPVQLAAKPVDWAKIYTQHLLEKAQSMNLSGFSIVLDCAHGAASNLAEKIFTATGANVLVAANTPNGKNINEDYGALYPHHILDLMKQVGADLGFAFDGDADRLVCVEPSGNIIDGNDLLVMLAQPYLLSGQINLSVGVAGSLMINGGVEQYFRQKNIPFIRTPVGDCEVAKALRKHQFFLGAEPCGHVVDLRGDFETGDGMNNALALLAQISNNRNFLTDIKQRYQQYPQVNKNVPLPSGGANSLKIQDFIKKQTAYCKQFDTKILIRPSGTEPVMRILLEGVEGEFLQKQCQVIEDFFMKLSA